MDLTIHHDGDIDKMSYVIIDATTSEVLKESVAPEDRAAIDEVLRTLTFSPFDPAVKGWPYDDDLRADAPLRTTDSISYPVPAPSSGIKISEWIADPTGTFINVSNGRSTMLVRRDSQSGALAQEILTMSAKDETAFDRYFASVQICGVDLEC